MIWRAKISFQINSCNVFLLLHKDFIKKKKRTMRDYIKLMIKLHRTHNKKKTPIVKKT